MNMDVAKELSIERLRELLNAPCEMERLDFKETLDLSSGRAYAELAKDVLAMANSGGGHIVVGIADTTRQPVSISDEVAVFFGASKTVNDKLYRYTRGHITVS